MLPDSASASTPDEELIALVAECLERMETEGAAAVEELCSRDPERADALRRHLARLGAFGLTQGAPSETLPERLGGFRLLARLGGGGMGVVHVALQEDLGRLVALKLVRPEHLWFSGARERFRREVETLARLAHPSIVPVFAGGEDKGVPYLAMELVRGASLSEVLSELRGRDPARLTGRDMAAAVSAVVARRDAAGLHAAGDAPRGATTPSAAKSATLAAAPTPRPVGTTSSAIGDIPLFAGSWVVVCLRIARALASALAHAHELGVLHRDVKPGNVMLTPEGRVLLLDFGLASAQGSTKLTGTGQPLGSPAYMSPEQLLGGAEGLDARTDIYSLGLSLYEMLTFRQPFATDNLQTTRELVLAGRAPAPRSFNPAVPRDVETVVLKAQDSEARRRYAHANAFVEDLDNLLALRPIAARRPGALLLARRWTQRHPAAAVGLAAAILLCVGGPLAYAVQERAAARRILEAWEQTEAQRARAERNFERAREAVDVLLTQVSEDDLLGVPRLEPLRRRLLQSALDFYERFLDDTPDDAALALDLARAADRAGRLLRHLGRYDESVAVHARQGALTGDLLARVGPKLREECLALLGRAESGRADALLRLGRADDAEAAIDAALVVQRDQVERNPQDWDARLSVEESLGYRCMILVASGKLEALEQARRDVSAWGEDLALRAADDEQRGMAAARLVTSLGNHASDLHKRGQHEQALHLAQRAVATAEDRLPELLADPGLAAGVLNAQCIAALVTARLHDPVAGEALLRRALDWTALAREHAPWSHPLRRLEASALNNLGTLLLGFERREEAAEALDRGLATLRAIVVDAPGVSDDEAALGGSLINRGSMLRDDGASDAARAQFEEALALGEAAMQRTRADALAHKVVFNSAWFLALTCLEAGDASAAAEAALALVRNFADEGRPQRIAAGLLARAVTLARAGTHPVPSERVQEWERAALTALAVAVRVGAVAVEELDSAEDLAGLRTHPDFAGLRAGAPGT